MASKYYSPSQYLRWFIRNDKLVLVTIYFDSTTKSVEPIYRAIDESLTDGIMVEYYGMPKKIDITDKNVHNVVPDVPERIHTALIDYILSQLYANKSEKGEADIVSSNQHYIAWKRRIAIANGGRIKEPRTHLTRTDARVNLI